MTPQFKTVFPSAATYDEYDQLNIKLPLYQEAAREVIAFHQLAPESLTQLAGTNVVFAFGNHILKIFPPAHDEFYKTERLVLKHLYQQLSIATPDIEFEGNISGWHYIIMSKLNGTLLEGLWETLSHDNKLIIMRELGGLIREVHRLPVEGLESIDSHWDEFIDNQIKQCVEQHTRTRLDGELVKQLPDYINSVKALLPRYGKSVLLTGEYTPMNLLVTQRDGVWHLNGLIDFGDCMLGMPEYDLLGPGVFLALGDKGLLREMLIAYGYPEEKLTPELSRMFTALMLLHRFSNFEVQIRIVGWKDKVKGLGDFEGLVWGLNSP